MTSLRDDEVTLAHPARRMRRLGRPRPRPVVASLLLLLLVVTVAACGTEPNPRVAPPSPATLDAGSSPTAPSSDEPFPVTIEHKYGTTEIAEEPERVITVGYTDQDAVLALGIVPVATRDFGIDRPGAIGVWAQDELEELGGDVPEVLSVAELDFEQVAALRPDLILGVSSGMDQDVYTTLSQIAPTVAQSGEYIDFGVPWQERARVVGRAVGKESEAEQRVADVEARFAAARQAHPEFEGAGGVVTGIGTGGELFVSGPAHQRARFLTSLGFEIPEAIVEIAGVEFFGEISSEQIGLIDTDVVVWRGVDPAQLADNDLYQQLDVAQQGRAIFLEDNGALGSALSHSTVLSLPLLLDELVPRLAAAVDGDPATELSPTS